MPEPTPSRENLADAQAAAGPCPHEAVERAWPLMVETIARGFAYREAETAERDACIAELEEALDACSLRNERDADRIAALEAENETMELQRQSAVDEMEEVCDARDKRVDELEKDLRANRAERGALRTRLAAVCAVRVRCVKESADVGAGAVMREVVRWLDAALGGPDA